MFCEPANVIDVRFQKLRRNCSVFFLLYVEKHWSLYRVSMDMIFIFDHFVKIRNIHIVGMFSNNTLLTGSLTFNFQFKNMHTCKIKKPTKRTIFCRKYYTTLQYRFPTCFRRLAVVITLGTGELLISDTVEPLITDTLINGHLQ
jgi:hypothetical protein